MLYFIVKKGSILSRSIKIALIQFSSILGNIEKNIKKAIEMIEIATINGSKIICFPETFASGYDLNFFKEKISSLAESLNGYTISSLRKIAEHKRVYIIAPIILKEDYKSSFTNSAVVIDDNGNIMGVYNKNHLWHIGEGNLFKKGSGYPIFKTKYCNIGILICYDLNLPEAARILTLKGAELIFLCSAWIQKDKYIYDILIPARALENEVFFAAVNMFDKDMNLFGNSKIANPKGNIVAKSIKHSEDILIYSIDLDEIAKARYNAPYLSQRRPEQYFPICN